MKNNAILLCGGIGKRMSPIPRCNKSLLNIKGEMNLKRIIRILYNQGVTDIVLATNPKSEEELIPLVREFQREFSDINIVISVASDYEEGCNNIVTLRAAAPLLSNSYIIETDQYYKSEVLEEFIKAEPMNYSYLFTQPRGEEDWAVISDEYNIVTEIQKSNIGAMKPCLSGIYYLREENSDVLVKRLSEYPHKDIYWEELLDIPSPEDVHPLINWYFPEGYSVEYDNISDLINNNLMDPQDIANLIDDNHSAERLGSMTNTTYKIRKDGVEYALRIPGYGTDRFVNHHRERYMEETVPLNLRPESSYFSNDEVKLSQYLDRYYVLKDFADIRKVVESLAGIHESSSDIPEHLIIDLSEEIHDYEDIYKGILEDYPNYSSYKSKVQGYLSAWSRVNPYCRVHRDLVPLNIMLNASGDVKFIDWEYAGYLSYYWDLASLICEYSDEYHVDLSNVFEEVVSAYPGEVIREDLWCWIAIVDFVWAVWSLAKVVLGDDVSEYGKHRYERSVRIIDKYMEEV